MSPANRSTLVDTCALLFDPGKQLPRQALEQALAHHCRFQGMYDRTCWKLAVRLAALLAGAPFSEQRHLFYPLHGAHNKPFGEKAAEWRHPVSAEARCTSLDQLADDAVQRITALFERIEAAGTLADILTDNPGENLLTGMHGACLAAMESSPAGGRRRS
jgi:hypothetical protein